MREVEEVAGMDDHGVPLEELEHDRLFGLGAPARGSPQTSRRRPAARRRGARAASARAARVVRPHAVEHLRADRGAAIEQRARRDLHRRRHRQIGVAISSSRPSASATSVGRAVNRDPSELDLRQAADFDSPPRRNVRHARCDKARRLGDVAGSSG